MGVSSWRKRLRAHDWLGAGIELLIVVVGILLALQVGNWNQDRADRARADGYYRRIGAELRTDQRNIDYAIVFWATVTRYGRASMAHAERGELREDSAWKTILAYYQAGQMLPFEFESTTFNEMRDRGDLGLIADETLRKALADYYRLSGSGTRAALLRHDPVYRQQIRGLMPWTVQQYIWDNCFRQGTGVQQELIDCPSPLRDDEAASLLETFRHSDALLQNLRIWIATLKISALVVDNQRTEARHLATRMDAARTH